ncbi:MAG: FAD-binding oxidoreductase [Chloroflexi bacterium]|nr:FAD-binding oxidoreductase [Chloroflexota bacterium]
MEQFEALKKRLIEVVGASNVADRSFMLRAYSRDFGIMPPHSPDVVVRPRTTQEISQIVQIANEFRVPIIPRGGGSAQEAGSTPSENGGITLETLRMNEILEIDESNGTVTCEAGITYVTLMSALEEKGWKIGIAPSGAMAGTPGAHIARPGVGWGNIKYVSSGDQVLGLKVVLPSGDVVSTGTAANPNSDVFFRYGLGPDATGLFVGAEGAFGLITECTLRMYPLPKKIYLERYKTTDLAEAIRVFRELALNTLVVYVSVPVIKPGQLIIFDVNVEGDEGEVTARVDKIRKLIQSHPGIEYVGPEGPQKFWNSRWFLTGEEFKEGTAGAVNYFLPFDKLEAATYAMKQIMDRHGIGNYAQQMFPEPTGSEHVSLMFHHQADAEEHSKIVDAMGEMMDKALEMGGAPYSKGRQWGPYLQKHLGGTGYWRLMQTIKKALDPNHIMNPGVVGL